MRRRERLLQTVVRGDADANIRFADLRMLIAHLGFKEQIRGSHYLFDREGVVEIVNLQGRSGARQAVPSAAGSTVDLEVQAWRRWMMYKYEIILYWSNDDQSFVAEAPELPGCMAHGEDQEVALRNIKDAMDFWIERAHELGRPVPQPKGERLVLA